MTEHGERAHSHLGASGMYRWSACPGSVRLEAQVPDQETEYAREGTAAHELAEKCLRNGLDAFGGPDFPDDMAPAVQVYLDTIRGDIPEGEQHAQHIEHKFDLSSIHPGCFGTADFVLWLPKQKLLRVYDYKHGAGVAVEARGNKQSRYYALGALTNLGYPAGEVEMVIVQPRCPHPDGPVRRERIAAIDLLDFAADLEEYARAAEDPNAPLIPGDHCRFCNAAAICPALQEKAQSLAKQEFRGDLFYDPDDLAETLKFVPVLEAWCKAVREFAYGEALHGRPPPGFKLVPKQARRAWADETTAAEKLRQEGAEPYDQKLVGVGEAEKRLKAVGYKAADAKAIVNELAPSVSSGETLAPESDSRPAINVDPQSEFSAAGGG